MDEFFQGIFCKEEEIAEARYWVTESDVNLRKVALGQQGFPSQLSMPVAMRTVVLRTSERLRRRDLSQLHEWQ